MIVTILPFQAPKRLPRRFPATEPVVWDWSARKNRTGKTLREQRASISLRNTLELCVFRTGSIPQLRGLLPGPPCCARGLVAQSVEQRPFKPLVVGSSPTQPTTSKAWETC